MFGARLGDAIHPPATRGWSLSRDRRNVFNPSVGSVGDWLSTGPDEGAAIGALAMAGAGTSTASRLWAWWSTECK